MAQEFTIKSEAIESKINQLLPSQGGYQAGVDFSASTMVIPIVDLTETAEGSALRQDLQTAISFNSNTAFNVSNATTTIINTTGFYRIFGSYYALQSTGSDQLNTFKINNGATDKTIFAFERILSSGSGSVLATYDFIVELDAGHSLKITSTDNSSSFIGSHRQIADLSGNLT